MHVHLVQSPNYERVRISSVQVWLWPGREKRYHSGARKRDGRSEGFWTGGSLCHVCNTPPRLVSTFIGCTGVTSGFTEFERRKAPQTPTPGDTLATPQGD